LKKIKILHLEDMPFDVEMVDRELKTAGIEFEKMVVENKADFIEALHSFSPDIILSDHSLPAFNSEKALKLAKEKLPHIPFILVTATVSEEFAVNVLKQGASDYILKTNIKRLPSSVTAAIEKSLMMEEKLLSEIKLKYSHQQIRNLASHLQDIREEERSAMAREVHDELGQQLTALKLDISWLSIKLNTAEEVIIKKLVEMEKLSTQALKTVKKIVTELHPAILDKLGIKDAIRWQSDEFEKRTGIKIELSLVHDPIAVDRKTAIALFRIYQESLTNIMRHAGATMVKCQFDKMDNQLVFSIEDNGVGFDENLVGYKHSLGLLGMKERAVMLGGELEIKSSPAKGTKIIVSIPF
jgi:signal transduction histidine kinase